MALSPAAPRRLHVTLDLAAEAVPVINYKKLKRERDRDHGASGGGEGASGKGAAGHRAAPSAAAPPSSSLARASSRMDGGGPKPGNGGPGGGVNHMADVIRRIEGRFHSSRFDDSDEDDDGSRGPDSPGPAGDGGDSASEDDDEPVDVNDPAAVEAAARRKAAKAAAKAVLRAKTRTAPVVEEWYDVDDDFIDDEELDEYFERNGRKDKLGGKGGDRFYVNKGEIEFVDDGTGAAAAAAAAEKRRRLDPGGRIEGGAPGGGSGSVKWTDTEMKTLRMGVKKHGHAWMTIKRDAEFGPVLQNFSNDAMKHKWKKMQENKAKKKLEAAQAQAQAQGKPADEPQRPRPAVVATDAGRVAVKNGSATVAAPGPEAAARRAPVEAGRGEGAAATPPTPFAPPSALPSQSVGVAPAVRAEAAANASTALASTASQQAAQRQMQQFQRLQQQRRREEEANGGVRRRATPLKEKSNVSAAVTAAAAAAAAASSKALTASGGLGSNGVYHPVLVRAIEEVRAAAAREEHPTKPRASLPHGIVQKLVNVSRVCKGDGSADAAQAQQALPRGLLKSLMEFLDPFCSIVTLQKRMSDIAKGVEGADVGA